MAIDIPRGTLSIPKGERKGKKTMANEMLLSFRRRRRTSKTLRVTSISSREGRVAKKRERSIDPKQERQRKRERERERERKRQQRLRGCVDAL